MFIKEIRKKNKGYDKTFIYHRLMESYRTKRGPRQKTVLNLGTLDLPKNQWKTLADHIEEMVCGQKSFVSVDETIGSLAQHYANIITQNGLLKRPTHDTSKQGLPDYETVDLNSLENTQSRTIGAEYVGLSMFRSLGLEKLLRRQGFDTDQVHLSILAIVGRLVHPSSENRTRQWAQHLSGLDELLGTDFRHLSNNALYRTSDLLFQNKAVIEEHLKLRERDLFTLQEKIILYDLTNTYCEGEAAQNPKAKRGRSKEKRKGRPLVTLGLVIDELGFPKTSKILKGNVSEPGTLLAMIETLQGEKLKKPTRLDSPKAQRGITVVLDAGIATEENLELLKSEGYDYVCVARNQPITPTEINGDDLVTIKKDKANKIEATLFKADGENILYCKSLAKGKKEAAMRALFQERFEEGLEHIAASLHKRGGTKRYDKVLLRLGRLKEKYTSLGHYYQIEVSQKDGIATSVRWEFEKKEKADHCFSGSYFLRTSRTDLNETELWSLYIMLTNVEDAFRTLKSELNLRPIYHRKESRTDTHLFLTVLAYHLLNSIRLKLRQHDVSMRWERVRELLTSHVRITTSLTTQEGERIDIRNSSVPEPFQRAVYDALGLSYFPLSARRNKT
jgi:transposase